MSGRVKRGNHTGSRRDADPAASAYREYEAAVRRRQLEADRAATREQIASLVRKGWRVGE